MTEPAGSARSSGRLSPSRIRSTPVTLIRSSVVIARVEPLTTTRRLAGPFDYLAGDLAVEVGSVVRVPFGRQSLDGVVVELAAASELPPERLLAPTAVRDEAIAPELVRLALWMAAEYCSTPARALSLVLPPRGRPRTELWAARTPAPLDGARLSERQRALLASLPRAAGRDLAALRRLEARGLVAIAPRARRRAPLTVARADVDVVLTAEQAAAVDAVEEGGAWLLHGVTGSGKTEVYLRAAAAALARGEGVIVLVPEIALTPQTVGRFQARFGDTVALLHSALSEGERHDEWRRLRTGEARIAVGPRSAVFAPVRDLGLVVLDEEHDPSYKHEGDPRYDARRVAAMRLRLARGDRAAPGHEVSAASVGRVGPAGGRPASAPRGGSAPRPAARRRRTRSAPRPAARRRRPGPGACSPAPPRRARRAGTGSRTCGSRSASARARSRRCACSTCAARATRCTRRRAARSARRARRSCS